MRLSKKGTILIVASWLILALVTLLLLRLTNISLSGQRIQVSDQTKPIRNRTLFRDGFIMDGWQGETTYMYTAAVNYGVIPPVRILIYPDNCVESLRINGQEYSLSEQHRCDRKGGVAFEIKNSGRIRDLALTVNDTGGRTSVFVRAESPLRTFAKALSAALFIAAMAGIFFALSAPKRIMILIVLGVLVRIVYLANTPYFDRTYDVDGHLEYISYVAQHEVLPPVIGGWEYYQPPMYYVTAAAVYGVTGWLGIANQYFALQVFSLVLYCVFLIYAYKILTRMHLRKTAVFFSFAMLLFWPTSITHSARIGNDLMLYTVYAASLFYGIRFAETHKKLDLFTAYLIASVAILTKSNGIALPVILTLTVAAGQGGWSWLKRNKLLFSGALLLVVLFFLVSMARLWQYPKLDPIIANIDILNRGLQVKNTVANMVSFDVYNFVTHPFANGWDDATGRQQFFTFLWKTSLFNENFDGQLLKTAAQAVMVLFLGLSIYALCGIFLAVKKGRIRDPAVLALLINAVVLLLFSFFARIRYPFAPTGDFRYIFPFLISFVYFFGYAMQYAEGKGRRFGAVPKLIAYLFVIISAVICLFLP